MRAVPVIRRSLRIDVIGKRRVLKFPVCSLSRASLVFLAQILITFQIQHNVVADCYIRMCDCEHNTAECVSVDVVEASSSLSS